MPKCHATEQHTLREALDCLQGTEAGSRTILRRLNLLSPFPKDAMILDVGAAHGRFLVACAKLGHEAVGLEPWPQAIEVAVALANHENVGIRIACGVAEALPFASEQFWLVHAMSVIEHVEDASQAFREAYRVLKPGGLFWFFTASCLCPRQGEIAGFPCFSWYPDRVKRRIMSWAIKHKPHLVGHTAHPAINWFTPWKAREMLRAAGFRSVYDRWDLPPLPEMPAIKRLGLRIIRSAFLTKCLADMVRPGCSFAAVK